MLETTYTDPETLNDYMVVTDEDNYISDIYTYSDNVNKLVSDWKSGKNPVFIHCPQIEVCDFFNNEIDGKFISIEN